MQTKQVNNSRLAQPVRSANHIFSMESLKHKAVKGLVTGAIFGVATNLVYGGGQIEFSGVNVPSFVPMAGVGLTASVISDITHDLIYPHLQGSSRKLSDLAATGVGVGISASAGAVLLSMSGVPSQNLMQGGLLCGGSYLLGDYVDSKFLTGEQGRLIF